MPKLQLDEKDVQRFDVEGYLLIQGFLDEEETALLRDTAKSDRLLDENAQIIDDGAGQPVRLALWNHPGDTLYGLIARSRSLVEGMEQLLGGEVYHYHSKMVLKDAEVGGAWAWHQDYGYWYHNGVLAPLLASASIAVDAATRANGCLQVIPGSHKLGRIDHSLTGDQAGADPERVAEIIRRVPVEYIEMAPGDVLLFHCNLLHSSDANGSDAPRWSMICCYNAARNDPFRESHHPRFTPLDKVNDDALRGTDHLLTASKDGSFWRKEEGHWRSASSPPRA